MSKEQYCSPHPAHAPLLLAAVCARWKSIATSTRDLWSSLNFQKSSLAENDTELLLLWLERSGSRPFSLRLVLEPAQSQPSASLTAFLSTVFDHLTRFTSLVICVEGPCPVLAESKSQILILQDLSLDVEWDDLTVTQLLCNQFRSSAMKSLTYVNFRGFRSDSSPRLDHDWTNVTRLYLAHEMSVMECGWILSQCRRVCEARFELVGYWGESSTDPLILAPMPLKYLRQLEISSLEDLSPLFNAFNSHSLHAMRISLPRSADPWPHIPFIDWIQRTGCRLQELRICGPVTEEECAEIALIAGIYPTVSDAPGM
ncbi:hypothetical protein R3P38DRAFT_2815704 [Favolaschia claudopus]|uniref:F-box domain-containing protein n=1 Tax=Favolaschia claudopus TaxID=2862362 RepID=A0AAV9Z174_9AGAR